VTGDANQDGNNTNDRLPGTKRNSFLGPDYASTDLRVARRLYAGDHMKLEVMAESFNVFNRDNPKIVTTSDGFVSNSAQFVQTTKNIGINYFPAQYRAATNFLKPNDAYAPRQVQFSLRLVFEQDFPWLERLRRRFLNVKPHIFLDLPREPCHNYRVQMGPVWGCR